MRTLCILCLALAGLCLHAADYYVDNVQGDDAFTGSAKAPGENGAGPFRTVAKALAKAGAGDTVHFNPTGQLYRQTVDLYGHQGGTPEQPLVIDGHGVTLSGAQPIAADGWTDAGDGVYTRDDVTSSVFLLVDGEMIFHRHAFDVIEEGEFTWMWDRLYFRFPKGAKREDFKITVGQPDGATVELDPKVWHPSHSSLKGVLRYSGLKPVTSVTLNGEEKPLITTVERLAPGMWTVRDKTLYYRLPEDKELADLDIQAIVRGNGVAVNGNTSNIIIRNFTATHVHNDGYNIHGNCKNIVFENCHAHHCGDEGYSSHDTCETSLDGGIYEYCCNGIANVNKAITTMRNVIVANNREVGFMARGQTRHVLENIICVDNPNQFSAGELEADNLLIITTADGPRSNGLSASGASKLRRVTILGSAQAMRFGQQEQALTVENVLIGPGQRLIHVRGDSPMDFLRLRQWVVAPDLLMQWSAKYPWKEQPMGEWAAEAEKAGAAKDIQVKELPELELLRAGKRPETLPAVGCSADLIDRYLQWRK